jgi:cytosine/adenosine deaminase-related metal-dependent hydrolase
MTAISRRGLLKMGAVAAAAPAIVRRLGAAQRPGSRRDGGALEASARAAVNPNHHIFLRGGTILTMDPAIGDFVRGDVHIQGKHIVAVARELRPPAGAEIIECTGTILIPGFVDCHRHSWSATLRQIIPNGVIGDYMSTTHQGFAPYYRPHDMYVGNLVTALGCINAGITCVIDNSHNSRSSDHSDAAIEALFDSGIRAVHASGPPQFGTWDKQWPQDWVRLQKKYFTSKDQLVTLRAFGPANRENWALARSLGLTIHADGISSDVVEAFAKEKLLGPDFTFNHASSLTDSAWRLVRETGCHVNVCTRSDAQYGLGSGSSAGVGGFQKALDFGVQPGFSVDNETSYSTDMFGEMRAAFFIQRALATNRRANKDVDAPMPVTVRQVLQCATVNGAACAAVLDRAGTLTPGKEADVVVIRADDMNMYPLNNAPGAVVQAAGVHNVDTVIIGGLIRKRRGALVGVNIPRYRQLVDESRKYLFDQRNYKLDILAS